MSDRLPYGQAYAIVTLLALLTWAFLAGAVIGAIKLLGTLN